MSEGADAEIEPDQPARIGPYRILDVIGEGGMGTVYLAEQKAPVRRRVALKVIKLGMDSRAVVARFDAERQALSLMEHSNIAKVFDCGLSDRGQPYFAMEYVKGIPITAYCDQNKLSVKDRIGLFQQVCSGVQHAHLKGVMHRDLKPDNVLVTLQDGKPLAKIIDFGLAKAMDHRLVEATIFTQQGTVVGTPEYMSPEQAGLGGLDVDTRTDVYSLGVLLYELLTGDLPFTRKELHQAGYLEMQRVIKEQEPSKPSTKVTTLGDRAISQAQLRALDVRSFARTLRGDLDWITLKALEKDRTRRYDTAQELAADLGRYLSLEPVLASPPSAGYRARKFVSRYRAQLTAGGVVVLASLSFGGWALSERSEADRQRRAAQAQREVATETARVLDAKVQDFDQLKGVVVLESVLAEERDLYPAWPERIEAMDAWLGGEARGLLGMLDGLDETLASLRSGAVPWAPRQPGAPLVYSFPADRQAEAFLHDTLAGLRAELEEFEVGVYARVARRLAWARGIDQLSRAHPRASVSWEDVRSGVASSRAYAGANVFVPEGGWIGLVPIGPNPATGLWEFYDLRSAAGGDIGTVAQLEIPTHAPDGTIPVDGASGLVFVLLPGGTFWMGTQDDDPNAPNYDAQRGADEVLRQVTLSPFLLSRYEMTQGQWERLWVWDEVDRAPSYHAVGGSDFMDGEVTGAHPVEQVDWHQCEELLARYGWELPTEAQWEYGCRADQPSGSWIVPIEELPRVANLASAEFERAGGSGEIESWSDGAAIHAPVGSYAANAFGLHDMLGNVWEWCRDGYGADAAARLGAERPGDGLREMEAPADRCLRGAAFNFPSTFARSGMRGRSAPTVRDDFVGLRPVRSVFR